MTKDLLDILNSNMRTYSKGQKKIAKFIIDHYDKAAFMTAAKLGDVVGVSESTVVRFATELGFSGYPKLQNQLQEMLRSRLTTVQRLDIADENIELSAIPERIMRMDSNRIEQTLTSLDAKEFENTIDCILSAKKIFVLGVRSSKMLAGFLAFYFNHMFENVLDISSSTAGEIFESMMHISEDDVLIAMSFPRYSQRTLKAATFAKNSGAKVIGITDSKTAPLASISNICLVARSDMASVVDSLVAPLSLLNAILVALSIRKRDDVSATYTKLEKIWSEYQVYETSGDNHE